MLGRIAGTEFKNLLADFPQKKFELRPESTAKSHFLQNHKRLSSTSLPASPSVRAWQQNSLYLFDLIVKDSYTNQIYWNIKTFRRFVNHQKLKKLKNWIMC